MARILKSLVEKVLKRHQPKRQQWQCKTPAIGILNDRWNAKSNADGDGDNDDEEEEFFKLNILKAKIRGKKEKKFNFWKADSICTLKKYATTWDCHWHIDIKCQLKSLPDRTEQHKERENKKSECARERGKLIKTPRIVTDRQTERKTRYGQWIVDCRLPAGIPAVCVA